MKENKEIKIVKRGEIYFGDIGQGIGSEQQGIRPLLILQNNVGNRHSPTTIVCLITSMSKKLSLPVHCKLPKEASHLPQDSILLLEQIRTIDKSRLIDKVSTLDETLMSDIDKRLKISLGLN